MGQGVPPELTTQLTELIGLRQEIAAASPSDMAHLSRTVSAAVASANTAAQQAQVAASTKAAESITIAAEASHRAVDSAMDYTRSLSLHFRSEEDEKEYRDREAERRVYIAQQQGQHTPQGNLNAAGAAIGQMADARAHGASGPEFDKQWNDLVSTTERLRAEAKAKGMSTEEFDQRLRGEIRFDMKSKGYTDAQIESLFASNPDPLQAAKTFVQDGGSVANIQHAVSMERTQSPTIETGTLTPKAQTDAKDLIAALKATGVVASDPLPSGAPHHGIVVAIAQIDAGVRTI